MQHLWWLRGKESTCQCRKHEFDPWPRKIPHAMEQLSPCTTTIEPVLWSPGATTTEHKCCDHWSPCPTAHTLQQEKPPQWEKPVQLNEEQPVLTATRQSLHTASKTAELKTNKQIKEIYWIKCSRPWLQRYSKYLGEESMNIES